MDACDVLIVGAGPAGSACAWALGRAGLDVVLVDRAAFPRDKVCAGWITPAVFEDLEIEPADYRSGRTLQPFARFRVGVAGADETTDIVYDRAVSFGIRRVEFDDYLLRRSGARLRLGTPVRSLRRDGARWIVDEALSAPMLVGAGGHECPVARLLNPAPDGGALVGAQEVEVPLDLRQQRACGVSADRPELYFCPDLAGYGWAIRKGPFINVGFGRIRAHGLPAATTAFVRFLVSRRRIPDDLRYDWRGHAYLTDEPPRRRLAGDGVLLAGDAAGLAFSRSGEGIRPAIESGLLAASTIVGAAGRYTRDGLAPYEQRVRTDGVESLGRWLMRGVPARATAAIGRRMIRMPWFARHVLMDRWFLHRQPHSRRG